MLADKGHYGYDLKSGSQEISRTLRLHDPISGIEPGRQSDVNTLTDYPRA